MNAAVNDVLSAEEISRLSQVASIEPGAMLRRLSARLAKPMTLAEFLSPELIAADIDFATLDRTERAIQKLESAGITDIADHSHYSSRNPIVPLQWSRDVLKQARDLAAAFDPIRKRGGKKV